MAGATDYSARKFLDWIVGKTSLPAAAASHVALFTAVGSDDGTGFTELSGGGYARAATVGADWNAAGASAPSTTSNANAIIFPTASGAWSNIIAFGLYDASTSGNLIIWDYLGNFDWLQFTCSLASPGVLTVPGHGYSNGDSAVVNTEHGGLTLPTTGGSWAGVKTVAGVTTNTFDLGVNTTSVGGGHVRKLTPASVSIGSVFSFSVGALMLRGS